MGHPPILLPRHLDLITVCRHRTRVEKATWTNEGACAWPRSHCLGPLTAIPTAARRRLLNAPLTFFRRPLCPSWGAVRAPAGCTPKPGDMGHGAAEFPGASRTPFHSQSAAAPPGPHLHPPRRPPSPFVPSSSPPGLTVTCQRPAAQRAPPAGSRPRLDPCGFPSARGPLGCSQGLPEKDALT